MVNHENMLIFIDNIAHDGEKLIPRGQSRTTVPGSQPLPMHISIVIMTIYSIKQRYQPIRFLHTEVQQPTWQRSVLGDGHESQYDSEAYQEDQDPFLALIKGVNSHLQDHYEFNQTNRYIMFYE